MDALDTTLYQEQIETIIADNPTTIRLTRAGTQGSEQTVRVSRAPRNSAERTSIAGVQVYADSVLIGTLSFDVLRGDRFALNSKTYEVVYVNNTSNIFKKAECIVNG